MVNADGVGVVSHAGVGLLREMAEETGLVGGLTAALLHTDRRVPVHAPGRVFTDLAVAVTDEANSVSGSWVAGAPCSVRSPGSPRPGGCWTGSRKRTRPGWGPRAAARERAWTAGAGPDLPEGLCLDSDATIQVRIGST